MSDPVKQHLPWPKEPPSPKSNSGAFFLASILGICLVTVNTAILAVQSLDNPWAFPFVFPVYVLLNLLFLFLHLYHRTPENSGKREIWKVSIWAILTALNIVFAYPNIVFAYPITTIMIIEMKYIVWGMAAFSTVSGFYFFFIFPKNSNNFYGACKSCDGQSVLDEKV